MEVLRGGDEELLIAEDSAIIPRRGERR